MSPEYGYIKSCKCKKASCEEALIVSESRIPRKDTVCGREIIFDSTLISTHDHNHRFQMNKDKSGVIFSGGKVEGSIESCPTRQSGNYLKKK